MHTESKLALRSMVDIRNGGRRKTSDADEKRDFILGELNGISR